MLAPKMMITMMIVMIVRTMTVILDILAGYNKRTLYFLI